MLHDPFLLAVHLAELLKPAENDLCGQGGEYESRVA
jgi:hypothetical protein